MLLSTIQKRVLVGTLLGDGHLERDGTYVRLKVDHGPVQRAYVWWKYEVFRNLTSRAPRLVRVLDPRTERVYQHWRFATVTMPELEPYYALFYKERKKVIPASIGQMLVSPQALAVWYMDDGARRTDCRALRLHTNCYSLQEQEILQGVLEHNFDVRVRVHRCGEGKYVLYIPAGEAQSFSDLVRPFVLAPLRGKLL
jgi:hypothetical protein